jgi:D-sedoheptulose 7-phosphate isomerase
MKNLIDSYLNKVKATIDGLSRNEIESFISVLIKARDNENTVFIMGNGGSASTASHFTCDLAKGVSYGSDKRFRVVCLNDNVPIMMAYSNDLSYDDVFIEQLKNQIKPNDVVIAISGSGNSKNIIKAVEYANQNNAISVGITGYNGGKLKQIATHSVNANIDDMQVSEDIHVIISHAVMQILCQSK